MRATRDLCADLVPVVAQLGYMKDLELEVSMFSLADIIASLVGFAQVSERSDINMDEIHQYLDYALVYYRQLNEAESPITTVDLGE